MNLVITKMSNGQVFVIDVESITKHLTLASLLKIANVGLIETIALFKKQLSGLMVKQNAIVGTNVLNSHLYCSTIMVTQ